MEKVEFSQPLFFLNVIGMHPLKNDRYSKLRQLLSIAICTCVMSSGILELLTNPGLKTYARATDTMVPMFQLVIKMVVLIGNRKEIEQLLNQSQKFWSLSEFGPSFQKFGTVHFFLGHFYAFYKIAITFTCFQFVLVKVIFNSREPVSISYGESDGFETPYDEIYLALHTMITVVSVNLLNGFDGLFFYFIGHILSELQMIKIAFGNYKILPTWNDKERFRVTVQHHSHILDFVQLFNDTFSVVLLVQYMSSLFGICFGLYLMSKDGLPPQFDLASKYMPYILSFILQTWTFCFAGHLLMDWSLDIPDEIFYSSWDKDWDYENGTGRVIAIKRGQKAANLTIGKFGNLDLESFKLAMQKSFSFFTFINTMIEKKNLEKK